MKSKRAALHEYLRNLLKKVAVDIGGIDMKRKFEVHSIRPSFRTDWEGRARFQWIIELTQRIAEYVDQDDLPEAERIPDYYFRGGCTLVVDSETGKVRYSIKKRLDETRRTRQRQYLLQDGNESLAATYFGGVGRKNNEPFAMLHRF